jgi:hypothetical protein
MLLYSSFTPTSLLLYSCFIYNRAVFLLYLCSCCTRALLLVCNCCSPVLRKYLQIYTRALLLLDSVFVWALQSKTRKRHLALVSKGLHGLQHSIVELKHIMTPTKLLARPGVVSVTIYCLLLNIYIYIYEYALTSPLLVFYSFFTSLDICNCCNPPSLTYIHWYSSCFTRILLVLFLVCVRVCVPAYWARRVCGGKWGAEERWSMGAWRVAAEGSWWSTATRTASCLSTHASRSSAGKYSNETGASSSSTCVDCDAGERDGCCSRVIWCPLTQSYIYSTPDLLLFYIYIYIYALLPLYVLYT